MENREILPNWHSWLLEHAWIVEAGFILLLLFLFNFLLKRALDRSKQKAQIKENDWRVHLDSSVIFPLKALLWVLSSSFLFYLTAQELKLADTLGFIAPLRNVAIVFFLTWFLIRWKKVFHNAMAARRVRGKPTFDPVSLEIIGKLFTIGVLFVALLVILGLFGLNIVPLVTFGGIGAAAFGFASREVIANFFGGLMLYATRPFTVNDLIEIPAKKITGHVEEIGWYATALRDLEKKPIYIPNALFSSEILLNLSRITHRCIEEKVRIRYADADKASNIIDEIRTLFDRHPEIDSHQPINIYLLTFGPYALEIEIKAYTLSTRYEDFMEIKQELLLHVHQIIESAGAEMAISRYEI